MNESAPILKVSGLSVRYGRTLALDRVTLQSERGSVTALLGRNGSGKSSLVKVLLGQLHPAEGEAEVFGQPAWRSRSTLMARIGVVPEEPDAPPAMTVRDLASFYRRLYPSWEAEGLAKRLDRFGIPEGVPFGSLSKGQKGLTLLALALAPSPELLILDDPTLGLDPVARRAFFEEVIRNLADHGTSVFLTTHDLAGIEPIADRVGILVRGRLLVDESMESLKSRFRRIRYGTELTEDPADAGKELDAFEAAQVKVRGWGHEAVVSNFNESAFAAFQSHPGVIDADASAMTLEEIFLAVAGEPGPRKGEVR